MTRKRDGQHESKRVSLTRREQLILKAMISINIRHSKRADELDNDPVNTTEELKALYKKIAGFEWKV